MNPWLNILIQIFAKSFNVIMKLLATRDVHKFMTLLGSEL